MHEPTPVSLTPDNHVHAGALLDVAALADHLGVPLRMARRLVDERRLPTVKIGRYVRVRVTDADDFLAKNTRPAVHR